MGQADYVASEDPTEKPSLRCRPNETWSFAGTTHRSRENDGLPLPGHAPFFPKPRDSTNDNPSAAAAVSG